MSTTSGITACTNTSISFPVIDGLNFQSLQVEPVSGYSATLPVLGSWIGHDVLNTTDLSFCNVSLTYTHDGHEDPINTQIYLPLAAVWNGRMVGVGGGGWAAGLFDLAKQNMVGAVSERYVAVATDAGGDPYHPDPENWALHSNGSANMYLLENFAHRAIGDTATIGKAVTKQFYGAPPLYSYWNGCSQGGRQGHALAQLYPDAYNGILAFAPALNLPTMLVSNYYTHLIMNQLGEYPHRCELEAIRKAAIAECDHEDGLSDGVIADPDICMSVFNPFDLVNTTVPCNTKKGSIKISEAAALVANAAWKGPRMWHGQRQWHGHSPETDLVGQFGRARTKCAGNKCSASIPHTFGTSFINHFVRKNINLAEITPYGYDIIFGEAKIYYDHILATIDPDLSGFRDRGGKLLSIHGLADEIIPSKATKEYYESVTNRDPAAQDYYRYFEAPGVGHCFGGVGAIPNGSFADLVAWVEKGRAPDTLLARSVPNAEGEVITRPLCPYPLVARYTGTRDSNDPSNFYCAHGYLSATPIKLVIERAKRLLGWKFKPHDEL